MHGYALGADGFRGREFPNPAMKAEEVRVSVEYVCLEPDDVLGPSEICPGGGLVGTVVECGDAATALMGARVLVPQVVACGECDTCRRGAATVCPNRYVLGTDRHGGCAKTVVCAGRWLTQMRDDLNLEGPLAALVAGPGLRAYALFCRAGVTAGDVTIVLGCGPTAEILALLAESRGAKLARSGHNGQEATVDDIEKQLADLSCQDRPQKIFVCSGEHHLAVAIDVAHPSSLITTATRVGNADVSILHARELSLLSLSYGHPDLLPETAALVVKGELDIGSILKEAKLGTESLDESHIAHNQGQCLVVHHV